MRAIFLPVTISPIGIRFSLPEIKRIATMLYRLPIKDRMVTDDLFKPIKYVISHEW